MSNLFNEMYSTDENLAVLDETMNVLNEVNRVMFDKATLRRRLISQCELIVAKERGDVVYDKYIKATKIRRKCRKLMHGKYESLAKVKAKEYLKSRKMATTPKADKK